jgi:glycosyltransferase involved in cell wall biosynthesis
MNLPPQFTIVTPAFNQAQYLEQAIRSVVSQQDVRIEYFVYDGGSTDGSAAIIAKHARALADWSSAPDAGQTDAIVRGWSKAHGAFVAWLNSDDYYVAGALALVAAEFERDEQIQVVIGACLMVDENGTVIGRKYARDFNLQMMLTTSGAALWWQRGCRMRRCIT